MRIHPSSSGKATSPGSPKDSSIPHIPLLLALALLQLFPGVRPAWLYAASQPGTAASTGNRLAYLDEFVDPYYPSATFAKLTTPQWIGEEDVDAAVVVSIDDMRDTAKYERFLRPILDRLKDIDGRAPVSIFTCVIDPLDPQLQSWLKEGLSFEVHTLKHPCPLLAGHDFNAARRTVDDCTDLLSRIPGTRPVAYRGPCSDVWNTQSPRVYAEILNRRTPHGAFVTMSSTVHHIFTSEDPSLPRGLTIDEEGRERFAKYTTGQIPMLGRTNYIYANAIANYPYPYVVGRLIWELPPAVPGDHQADFYIPAYGRNTVRDWKAAVDATVVKQGIMTLLFHPHGKCKPEEIVDVIQHAVTKHGPKVRFLNCAEVQDRLNRHLLAGQPLRNALGGDNGVRLLDLNNDGYMDVVIGNDQLRVTRLWDPVHRRWRESEFPVEIASVGRDGRTGDHGVRFGILRTNGFASCIVRNERVAGVWHFDGTKWQPDPAGLRGLVHQDRLIATSREAKDQGVRLRDLDRDGICELIVGNPDQNAVFHWLPEASAWEPNRFALPTNTVIVDANGQDAGLRFVDVNGDGLDDVLFSDPDRYSLTLFVQPGVWRAFDTRGWTRPVIRGTRGDPAEIPPIIRGGDHPNNGAWFHRSRLFIQNEDTGNLLHHTLSFSFDDLVRGLQPPPLSPDESMATIAIPAGFQLELVAAEPLVVDPVSIDWGPDGRLWVVEMRDYPLGMDGKGQPGGTIRVLEDRDHDGRFDHSTVFIDGLNFPTGVMPWGRGALISAAPDILYAEDTDGDGRADVRRVLFTGFGQGNQQHRVNGFDHGLDNWIYAATGGSGGTITFRNVADPSAGAVPPVLPGLTRPDDLDIRGHDIRFQPDTGALQRVAGVTEFGRHRDDWGNWFGNTYANWGWHYSFPVEYAHRNPFARVPPARRDLAQYPGARRIYRRSPLLARPQLGQPLDQVTSPCSLNPYRDTQLGPDFENVVFICEVDKSVVHREVLEPDGVSFRSHRAPGDEGREFISASDNWFRPTQTKTGPDGALYIVDMYRLIIEHEDYYPADLRQLLDFRAGSDKGRIYRLSRKGEPLRKVPRFDPMDTAGLVAALESPNGWQRDMAQRLLVRQGDPAAGPRVQGLFDRSLDPRCRLQALCTLDGLGAVTAAGMATALRDPDARVREHAVRISERFLSGNRASPSPAPLLKALSERVDDPALRVRYQLAFSLGQSADPDAGLLLARLAERDADSTDIQAAIQTSLIPHLDILLQHLARSGTSPKRETLSAWLRTAGGVDRPGVTAAALACLSQPGRWDPATQFAITAAYLDGIDGSGQGHAAMPAQLQSILDHARRVATSAGAPIEHRALAALLLNRTVGNDSDRTLLASLLASENADVLQQAALAALARHEDKAAGATILRHWPALRPKAKDDAITLLIGRGDSALALLGAVDRGEVARGLLGPLRQEQLRKHPDAAVRELARTVLTAPATDRQRILAEYQSTMPKHGDPARGEVLYRENCATCHRFRAEGNRVGPDLDGMREKPDAQLLQSILDPNAAVDPTYVQYAVVLKDGREMAGIIGGETPSGLTLRLPGGEAPSILRNDIRQVRSTERSLMPEGIEAALDPKGVADVIAWLKSDPAVRASAKP